MFEWIREWILKLIGRDKKISLGFYGAPNVGKTSLANRIAMDLAGEPVGIVSMVPHETRAVQNKERVVLHVNGYKLTMNLLDMPGVAVKVDYRDFLNYGLSVDQAKQRAREATKGIIEAIKWMENVDAALLVVDSTRDPSEQVNVTLLGNLEARGIPVIMVANKIDLENSNAQKYKETFADYPLVPVSALNGTNMFLLYRKIGDAVKTRKKASM